MLNSYPSLRQAIMNKTRGRKHEVNLSTGPEMWMRMPNGFDREIAVYLENGGWRPVATILPDNSLSIDIDNWHTQTSCKIIAEVAGRHAYLRKSHMWLEGLPVDGRIHFDSDRSFVPPPRLQAMVATARARCLCVSVFDLPPAKRLAYEIGVWRPKHAVTQQCVDYVTGKCEKDKLSPHDILTVTYETNRVIQRVLEEAV